MERAINPSRWADTQALDRRIGVSREVERTVTQLLQRIRPLRIQAPPTRPAGLPRRLPTAQEVPHMPKSFSMLHTDAGLQSRSRRLRATLAVWPPVIALLLSSSCDRQPTSPALSPEKPSALLVPAAMPFSSATLGYYHGCGLRSDGVVECWGDNGESQAPATKAAVSGAIVEVAAGVAFNCALTTAGVVECWGQPGSSWALPSHSATTGTFTRVSAGFTHACGLRSDGAAE
jgi:hypothetical protein